MKLELVLDKLNSFEKNSFLKIINDIVAGSHKNSREVEKILTATDKDLKNIDNVNIAKVFRLVEDEFAEYIRAEFVDITSQLDIMTDIVIRDGNCIMRQEWFSMLYERELKGLKKKVKEIEKSFETEKSEIDEQRKRDYQIYRACLRTAYTNDEQQNADKKITSDELSILLTLTNQLELSQEEIKLINYMVVPVQKHEIDTVINNLKNIGVLFFSKKQNTIYVADEVVRVLRKVRGKDVADKFFRRILRLMREPQINLVCRKHNIDWKQPFAKKVEALPPLVGCRQACFPLNTLPFEAQ